MNQLTIRDKNGKLVTSSIEISAMTGKRHDHLLRDIDGYIEILQKTTAPKIGVSEFFELSSYQDSTGRTLRSYDLTRKGCDMVANKMTGEKGVLFTAMYVMRFEEMEKQLIDQHTPSYMIINPVERAKKWIEEEETRQQLATKAMLLEKQVSEITPKLTYLDRILSSKGTVTATQIAKDYDLTGQALNKILHEEKIQYKQNGQWLLYAKYMNKGYTRSETIDITRSNGEQDVTVNTRWTQKGRLFIHEILAKRGIIPYMDRKDIGA